MARILSISYDATLLLTRELLLRQMGYEVVSAEGFAQANKACDAEGQFNLIILGHSIPHDDKEVLVERCTRACACPVLALLRANEGPVRGAIKSVDSGDPNAFIDAVREIAPAHSRPGRA